MALSIRTQRSTESDPAEAYPQRCRSPWPAAATYRTAQRSEDVIVLFVEPNGVAWIIDSVGDIFAVESFRIRLTDAGLRRILEEIAA